MKFGVSIKNARDPPGGADRCTDLCERGGCVGRGSGGPGQPPVRVRPTACGRWPPGTFWRRCSSKRRGPWRESRRKSGRHDKRMARGGSACVTGSNPRCERPSAPLTFQNRNSLKRVNNSSLLFLPPSRGASHAATHCPTDPQGSVHGPLQDQTHELSLLFTAAQTQRRKADTQQVHGS